MTLLAPLWLLLLLPWAALWAWRGRGGDARRVPFLHLWPRSSATTGPRRRRPPLWAVLLLLAGGLAIVAAAGPARVVPAKALTLAIDCGPALTPARLREALARLPVDATTRLHVVPSVGEAFDQVGGVDPARLARSVVADDDALCQAARRAGGAVVVVADHLVTGLPTGMPVVTPLTPFDNAGIDRFAVVAFSPKAAATLPGAPAPGMRAQAMVRVVNHTARARARLRVNDTDQPIDLPPPGGTRDYFLDLPVPVDNAVATLLDERGGPFGDDLAADDRAYLVRTNRTPRVEPRGPLPAALGRLLAVYAARRPPEPGGGAITIGPGLGDGPGVQLGGPFVTQRPRGVPHAITIDSDHPVTRAADLRGLLGAPRTQAEPPDDGRGPWRVLMRDDEALLAVRETPARQAWVGVDTTAIADTPTFVVLWADLLDWLGGGAAAWTSGPWHDGLTPIDVADASLAGGPGLYREGDRPVAVAMPAVRPGAVAGGGALPAAITTTTVSVGPWVLLVALAVMTLGLMAALRQDAHSRSRRTDPAREDARVRREHE